MSYQIFQLMGEFYKNPFFRSVIFVPLLIYATSSPWAQFAGNEFKPIYCVAPFSKNFLEKFILRKPINEQTYPQGLLQVFLEDPELRLLAVPPEKGGPSNQNVYAIEGIALILSLIFVALPTSPTQLIGFIISMSSNFGYVLNLILYENLTLSQIEWGVYVDIAFTLLGLVCIVY